MNSPIFSTPPIFWMSSSMFSAASLAPPCAGPHRQATPAAIAANGLVPDEPHRRTVEVEAFCSWSACRMKMRSSARTSTSFGAVLLARRGEHHAHEVAAYDRSLRG